MAAIQCHKPALAPVNLRAAPDRQYVPYPAPRSVTCNPVPGKLCHYYDFSSIRVRLTACYLGISLTPHRKPTLRRLAHIAVLAAPLLASPVFAQDLLAGIDLNSPQMTLAELTRDEVIEVISGPEVVDLTGRLLNGLDLSGLDLSGTVLRAARLNGANLSGANMAGAVLDQAWLIEADLSDVDLTRASLFQTQFLNARLARADLSDARAAANFTGADLTGAIFAGADLSADMKNQSMGLMRGVLRQVRAEGVDFTGANLMRADLEFARLSGANFTDANLMMATLGGADLSGADMLGARLENADLTSTRITGLKNADQTELAKARNLDRAIRN